MAITTAMCTSFKKELMDKAHDLDTDVIKCALYNTSATLSASTTVYTTTNEVTGTNYTAGGNTLSGGVLATSGTTAFADWADTAWPNVSITARGCMLYNSSNGNKALSVHDFGAAQTATAQTFTLQFPAADATNAIIRI